MELRYSGDPSDRTDVLRLRMDMMPVARGRESNIVALLFWKNLDYLGDSHVETEIYYTQGRRGIPMFVPHGALPAKLGPY